MKMSRILLLLLFAGFHASAQLDSEFALPAKWSKDFTISLSYHGSMDGSKTDLRFTYDSCIYVRNSGMNAPKKTVYLLTESDRVAILKNLHELKVDAIHSESSRTPVDDGWSSSICFNYHCVSEGPSVVMSEYDKNVFSTAYHFLEDFAGKKRKQ